MPAIVPIGCTVYRKWSGLSIGIRPVHHTQHITAAAVPASAAYTARPPCSRWAPEPTTRNLLTAATAVTDTAYRDASSHSSGAWQEMHAVVHVHHTGATDQVANDLQHRRLAAVPSACHSHAPSCCPHHDVTTVTSSCQHASVPDTLTAHTASQPQCCTVLDLTNQANSWVHTAAITWPPRPPQSPPRVQPAHTRTSKAVACRKGTS